MSLCSVNAFWLSDCLNLSACCERKTLWSQCVYCVRDSSRVLPVGNVQSSLSQSRWRDRHQVCDVRSYASRSLYRRRQSHRQPWRHPRLSGGRHWLRQSPVLRQDALWHLRTEPWAPQFQTVFKPTHHVSRSVILMSFRLLDRWRPCLYIASRVG